MISQKQLDEARINRHGYEAYKALKKATVGIAGCGGLGSHVAISLARMGIGHLILADYDIVDITNIHRQAYRLEHINNYKTHALRDEIYAIDPFLKVTTYTDRLNAKNIQTIFQNASIVCECLDHPYEKAMLFENHHIFFPEKSLITASGMAGKGSANDIRTTQPFQNVYLCGDGTSDISKDGHLYAARVAICANHQALMILRLLLNLKEA